MLCRIVPTKSKSMVSLTRPRAPSTPRMSVALTMEYNGGSRMGHLGQMPPPRGRPRKSQPYRLVIKIINFMSGQDQFSYIYI